MITEEAERRAKILTFWQQHGFEATKDAYALSLRTLRDWKSRLKMGSGKLESLNPKSRAPKKTRRRTWDPRILEEIRRLRERYPNLGPQKIFPLLRAFCVTISTPCPKPITIERLIRDMGGLRVFPTRITGTGRVKRVPTPVVRKPKQFKAEYPGHCVAFDTVELRTLSGERWYIVTAEDIYTRTAFAFLTRSHASLAARAIFAEVQQRFPHVIDMVLTDNGSEFKKHFAQEVTALAITHYHTYPHTPKMNAHIERFNRTMQEEFTRYHMGLLSVDRVQFEEKLEEYLLFYNTVRVHGAFKNLQSPYQFMVQSEELIALHGGKCRKG
jgi:transposase InsO family protein